MSVLTKPPIKETSANQPQLALTLGCNAAGKTVLQRRYMSYPLSVSPIFRLDENNSFTSANTANNNTEQPGSRAYLYRMNTSPGLLAGDVLQMAFKLETGSSLLLADQAATKVHQMPEQGDSHHRTARVHYEIEVGDRATLEFLPEPLILFKDSALKQTTEIILHPSAGLSWGEIILPGRLARGERYQFQDYWSRTQIRAAEDTNILEKDASEETTTSLGHVWFVEAMKLMGKNNPFTDNQLFANGSVLGSLILVLPEAVSTPANLKALSQQIDQLSNVDLSLELASSILPGERGLFVRAIASTTRDLQASFKAAANYVRQIRNQPELPYSL